MESGLRTKNEKFPQWIFRSSGQDLKFIHSKVFSSADLIVTQDAWNSFIVSPVCDKNSPLEIPETKAPFFLLKCLIRFMLPLKIKSINTLDTC